MDPGIKTPLVDFFRRGDVARDAKLLAAQGALATRALEQLALLVLLHDDADPEVAASARATITALPAEPVSAFLGRTDVPSEMREFFANRGIPTGPPVPGDAVEPLIDRDEPLPEPEGDQHSAALLSTLAVTDRLKLAMKGTREQRAVLVRDSNRLVSVAVLSSPKLSESEVEAFARMGNVSEEVLRIIGHNRTWTKNYPIIWALIRNPKTPPAIALSFINRLNDRDLKALSVDRNVPEALRVTARKYIVKGLDR
ncbi:MAG TPA: hypothetical protein VK886_17100 [Vicinamibacterales bacterium]|nr:hypothetical protein [Vicinamibacterales bacterium]